MSEKPEIEKLRVLHDLQTQFDVPEAVRGTLHAQLSENDQARLDRFLRGFRIEDWFEWIHCALPWVQLIHALDQQQFPENSKAIYQVPDFLVVVETSALTHQPLLVDVKQVQRDKTTLKLQDSQVELAEKYADMLNVPLVYSVYWEGLNGWTMNTPDAFENKSSCRKLSMPRAFELDCSFILGDVSYYIPHALTRVSRFSKRDVSDSVVRHEEFGRIVSDVVTLGENQVEMIDVESAAIDSMLTMSQQSREDLGNGDTQLVETPEDHYILKLSSWITRHIGIFNTPPSEQYSNLSAKVITHLMRKLDCPLLHVFPLGATEQLKRLEALFLTPAVSAPLSSDE